MRELEVWSVRASCCDVGGSLRQDKCGGGRAAGELQESLCWVIRDLYVPHLITIWLRECRFGICSPFYGLCCLAAFSLRGRSPSRNKMLTPRDDSG